MTPASESCFIKKRANSRSRDYALFCRAVGSVIPCLVASKARMVPRVARTIFSPNLMRFGARRAEGRRRADSRYVTASEGRLEYISGPSKFIVNEVGAAKLRISVSY